jgi:GST-like protein
MQTLSWLLWQVGGLGPMAGQAHHFRAFAEEEVPYGIRRYTNEVNRLYGVMDRQLGKNEYLAGEYSIADIACWPWVVPHERQGQTLDDFTHLKRWFETVRERPGVQRGFALGHETVMDREGYRFLYGQTAAMVDEQKSRLSGNDTESTT